MADSTRIEHDYLPHQMQQGAEDLPENLLGPLAKDPTNDKRQQAKHNQRLNKCVQGPGVGNAKLVAENAR